MAHSHHYHVGSIQLLLASRLRLQPRGHPSRPRLHASTDATSGAKGLWPTSGFLELLSTEAGVPFFTLQQRSRSSAVFASATSLWGAFTRSCGGTAAHTSVLCCGCCFTPANSHHTPFAYRRRPADVAEGFPAAGACTSSGWYMSHGLGARICIAAGARRGLDAFPAGV